MEFRTLRTAFIAAKEMQKSISISIGPSQEVEAPTNQDVLPHSLFAKTRGYIIKVVYQINISYHQTAYDSCAVMIRRLIEVLIIEVYDSKNLNHKIQDSKGNYLYLGDLIDKILVEPSITLNRNSKKALASLKDIGDLSAHSRNYNAQRSDIDKISSGLRVTVEDLLYTAGLK